MSRESGEYFKALNLTSMWDEFSLHPAAGNPSLTHGLVHPFGGQRRLLCLNHVRQYRADDILVNDGVHFNQQPLPSFFFQ